MKDNKPGVVLCGSGIVKHIKPNDTISTEVQKFAAAMQYKIDKNAHKDNWPDRDAKGERSWKTCDIDFLLRKLEEEHTELVNAVIAYQAGNGKLDDVKHEAADTGNISMMIADRLGALDT